MCHAIDALAGAVSSLTSRDSREIRIVATVEGSRSSNRGVGASTERVGIPCSPGSTGAPKFA